MRFEAARRWLEATLSSDVEVGIPFQSVLPFVRIVTNRSLLSTDAHLAALAIEHEATLMTADAYFARFRGLRWRNPLVIGA